MHTTTKALFLEDNGKIDMAIKYKKILDSAHEENPVYKFLVFYDLLSEWFKDPKLSRFTDYEDIFYNFGLFIFFLQKYI